MYREFFVGFAMLIVTAIFYRLACLVEISEACIFPITVMTAMLVLALIHLAQSIFRFVRIQGRGSARGTKDPEQPAVWKPVVATLACILVYFLIMERLGFYTSGLLFYLTVSLLLQRQAFTFRGAMVRLFTAATFIGILFILFKLILAVQMPKGVLI